MKDLHNHKFIVFGADHYNPLGICRSLGEVGIRPIAVLTSDRGMITHCKYVDIIHKVSDIPEGFELILRLYGDEREKPFLYTSDDTTTCYLESNYDKLIDRFYFFNGGKNGQLSHFMNKESICLAASKAGCDYPKSEVLTKGELPKTLSYPIITKAIISTLDNWKGDSFICNNPEELLEKYHEIRSEMIVAQEYIVKKNELCIDGFSINGGAQICVPYKAHYNHLPPKSYGNYMTFYKFEDAQVVEQIQNILKQADFTGIFSVEFLVTMDDKLKFLEVNFRNSTWSYAYTYGGVNLPYLWAKSMLEGRIDKSTIVLKDMPFTAMVEMTDLSECVKYKLVSIPKWIKERCAVDCTFEYNRKDPKPFYYRFINAFRNKILKS